MAIPTSTPITPVTTPSTVTNNPWLQSVPDWKQIAKTFAQELGNDRLVQRKEELLVYECDGLTSYRQRPALVVLPRNTEEVAKAVQLCNQFQVPFVTRGSGTGLSGGALPLENSVLIVTTLMRKVLDVDFVNQRVVVQPGVINTSVTQAVSAAGFFYAPDPSSQTICSIGGNLAENSGGVHCLKYGVTTNHVLGLKLVLADGTIVDIGSKIPEMPGYDLTGLFVGSEGTLGIVTEITVSLTPRPKPPVTLIATFSDIATAASCIPELVALRPSMLEIMDQATLAAVESWKPMGFAEVGAVVILQSDDDPSICERAAEIATKSGALDASFSDDPRDSADLIQVRKLAYPALERRGVALLDDVCVPISAIGALVTKVTEIAKSESLLIGVFGHAGDGNMHPTIIYPHNDKEAEARALEAFNEIIALAQSLGGTASGEHGIGGLKLSALINETPERILKIQKEIKSILDPNKIFNPGKKFPL